MRFRTQSIEWHTHISDTIAVAEVFGIKELPSDYRHSRLWQAELIPVKALKGRCPGKLSVSQYHAKDRKPSIFSAVKLEAGHQVLLFKQRGIAAYQRDRYLYWTSLTRQICVLSVHGVYNNDGRQLTNGNEILETVRERIALDKPSRIKRRGVLTLFSPASGVEAYWDFVRTAEPEFKPVFIKALREEHYLELESAIYNLISYPGKETVDLIRPFLRHPYAEKRHGDVIIYPLRQLAHLALKLLGARVAKPPGYYPAFDSWLMGVGFEDEGEFPCGDWKRLDATDRYRPGKGEPVLC